MAKQPVNSGEAQDTVFDNLDLSAEELGVEEDDGDIGGEAEGGEEPERAVREDRGSGDEDEGDEGGEDLDQLAELVTHTSAQGKQRIVAKGTKVDAKGNVVDAKGKIIARAGSERRFYDQANQARAQLNEANQRTQDLDQRLRRAVELGTEAYTRLKAIQEQQNTGSQLGLQPQEQVEALQFYSEFKRDAPAAAKKLLTRLAANGMDMTQLGLSGGFDPKSLMDLVKGEIEKGIKPLTERTAQERQQAEQQQRLEAQFRETEAEVNDYFRRNPNMQQYIPVFERVMKEFPGMTLGEAGARIELNLLKQQRSQAPNPQRRSLPTGQRGPVGNSRSETAMAGPNDSWDSIIRGVLDEHGI